MNQIQTEVIFLNLLRQADEFVFAILGTNPTPDAGSFRARVVSLYHTFQADKPAFVASSVQLGFLATLLKEYAAFRLSPIEQIGTPEILIGQIRWEDIYDKPDILAASSDWADITNKPATFAPSAHAHDYASITDKPATFAPSAHGHAYSEITDKPATFAPRHEIVIYTGNGNASRVLALSNGFAPVLAIVRGANATLYIMFSGSGISGSSTTSVTITANNASGTAYQVIFWG